MTAAVVIFGIVYLFIALSKIPNAVIAIIGAVTLLLLHVVTEEEVFHHIDLEVIFLLAAMMSLANVAGRTGAFDWAAIKSAQLVRGDGFLILVLLAILTAVASAFLDNVTVVVLAVPITLSLCKTLKLDPIPFLLSQVFASNIGRGRNHRRRPAQYYYRKRSRHRLRGVHGTHHDTRPTLDVGSDRTPIHLVSQQSLHGRRQPPVRHGATP
ncbi:MAG TPA: hypothetical protein DEW32_12440 [Dehalococcoidia bacterium]|nr:hypothetical protein [Dehalococcoidia bacterium]